MTALQPRQADVVATALAQPFAGYSRPSRLALTPRAERVLASSALLATMVAGGVLLGSQNRRA